MALYCPYCDIEINEKQLEAEDGCCPECGAFISASTVVSDDDEDDEFADEFGEDDNLGEDDDLGKFDDEDSEGSSEEDEF